jgi:hypothetical protein
MQHPFVCCNIVPAQLADLWFPVMHLAWPSERTLLHPLRHCPHAKDGVLVGSPRAFQPWAPTEPCVTVSHYTALIILAIREI